MMATHQPQKDLFAFHVDLDQRVRPHHPLRQVKKLIDFSFVRAEVARTYGRNGNPGDEGQLLTLDEMSVVRS